MSNDRTIHAETGHAELVRYDRAGKWYAENTAAKRAGLQPWRTQLTLAEAVQWVLDQPDSAVQIHWYRCGGQAFNSRLRKALAKRQETARG